MPSWLSATSAGPSGGQPSEAIPTDGWFDSNLPPAALQPEAGNLRASDDDPDSQAAHEGLADGLAELPIGLTHPAAPAGPGQLPTGQGEDQPG